MSDNWISYSSDRLAAVVLVDVGIIEQVSINEFPLMFMIKIKLKEANENGLPTGEYLSVISQMGDDIDEYCEKNNIYCVGRITGNSVRVFYIYSNEFDGHEKSIREIIEIKYKHEFIFEEGEDKEWNIYNNILLPSTSEKLALSNVEVIKQLQKKGDTITRKRRVDHFLYFRNINDRTAFRVFAQAEGFIICKEDTFDDGDYPFSVHICHNMIPCIENINLITTKLREKATELNGDYDGWGTDIVKEKKKKLFKLFCQSK